MAGINPKNWGREKAIEKTYQEVLTTVVDLETKFDGKIG